MNDYDVRIADVKGKHVWHLHADADEFFLVLDGRFRHRPARRREYREHPCASDGRRVRRIQGHRAQAVVAATAIRMFEPSGTLIIGDRYEGETPDRVGGGVVAGVGV